MQRYEISKVIRVNKYYKSWPIEIQKIGITKDNKLNQLLLQVKMCNLSSKTIKAVYLTGITYDDSYDKLGEIECIFQDLHIKPEETFGDNHPVILTDKTVRNVDLKVNKIVFENGEVFRGDIHEEPLIINALDKPLDNDLLFYEYVRLNDNNQIHSVLNYPIKIDDIWICCCGRINNNNSDYCVRCERSKEYIFKTSQEDYLVKSKEEYEKFIIAQEEEKIVLQHEKEKAEKAAKDIQNKKNKKILQICVGAFAVFFIIALIINAGKIKYTVKSEYKNKGYTYTMKVTSNVKSIKDLDKLEEIILAESQKTRDINKTRITTYSVDTPNFFAVFNIYGKQSKYGPKLAITDVNVVLHSLDRAPTFTEDDVQEMFKRINTQLLN